MPVAADPGYRVRPGPDIGACREGSQGPDGGTAAKGGRRAETADPERANPLRTRSSRAQSRRAASVRARAEGFGCRDVLEVVLGLPVAAHIGRSSDRAQLPLPCPSERAPASLRRSGSRGARPQAGNGALAPPQLRDTPDRSRRGHPHRAGVARACGSGDDHGLHARGRQQQARGREPARPGLDRRDQEVPSGRADVARRRQRSVGSRR